VSIQISRDPSELGHPVGKAAGVSPPSATARVFKKSQRQENAVGDLKAHASFAVEITSLLLWTRLPIG
jgi:hypothetical protein